MFVLKSVRYRSFHETLFRMIHIDIAGFWDFWPTKPLPDVTNPVIILHGTAL